MFGARTSALNLRNAPKKRSNLRKTSKMEKKKMNELFEIMMEKFQKNNGKK